MTSMWRSIVNRRMLVCALLGFSSGLPLYVLVSLLPAWLRTRGVGLQEIGLLGTLRAPYTWKFLWAPLLDRFQLPWLGRRRDWMLLTQLLLLTSLMSFALLAERPTLWIVGTLTAIAALFGATQDIALDAYRRELLPDEELAMGSSIWVNTYRAAGLIPGGLALIAADYVSWAWVHVSMGLCMLVGVVTTYFAPDVSAPPSTPKTFRDAVVGPFHEFFTRRDLKSAVLLLAFLLLYKLGDNLATALATPFYIDMGFSLAEIGSLVKLIALWSMVSGSLIGGAVITRIGIDRALWIFGGAQMVSILGFAALAELGRNLWALGAAVLFEYLGVGLGTAAFVAFIARATDKRFSGTQYALFSSFIALPAILAGWVAGALIEKVGYTAFFLLCTALAAPGMLMLARVAPWRAQTEGKR